MTVTVDNPETPVVISGGNANGPSSPYSCVPISLAHTVLCYDSVNEYPSDQYLVMFGVPEGIDVLGIDLSTDLTKSTYMATSVLPLNAEAMSPLSTWLLDYNYTPVPMVSFFQLPPFFFVEFIINWNQSIQH